jgi:hypothetical protein
MLYRMQHSGMWQLWDVLDHRACACRWGALYTCRVSAQAGCCCMQYHSLYFPFIVFQDASKHARCYCGTKPVHRCVCGWPFMVASAQERSNTSHGHHRGQAQQAAPIITNNFQISACHESRPVRTRHSQQRTHVHTMHAHCHDMYMSGHASHQWGSACIHGGLSWRIKVRSCFMAALRSVSARLARGPFPQVSCKARSAAPSQALWSSCPTISSLLRTSDCAANGARQRNTKGWTTCTTCWCTQGCPAANRAPNSPSRLRPTRLALGL